MHQIAVPFHWGGIGRVRGDAANELFPLIADPNVRIPESKVITADLVPGRCRRRRRARAAAIEAATIGARDPGPRVVRHRDLPGVGPAAEPAEIEPERPTSSGPEPKGP